MRSLVRLLVVAALLVAAFLLNPTPEQHRAKIHSTNPLERLNKEVKRRADVVGIFPNEASIIRLIGAVLLEQNDEWQLQHRYMQVEAMAERAAEAARTASDRLTQQMLNIGQSASALEQHIEQTQEATREKDSEAFARRVSLLIDSMHSAAIDVGKILSDEIDDRAWDSYLKGNRGVFTRRAVKLLEGLPDDQAIRILRQIS